MNLIFGRVWTMPKTEKQSLNPFIPGAIIFVLVLVLEVFTSENIDSFSLGYIAGQGAFRAFLPSFLVWIMISFSRNKWSTIKVSLIYGLIFFAYILVRILSKLAPYSDATP